MCAARMGGFVAPRFSKQGSLFQQIFRDSEQRWVFLKLEKKLSKMGSFPPKFIIKVGMMATVTN